MQNNPALFLLYFIPLLSRFYLRQTGYFFPFSALSENTQDHTIQTRNYMNNNAIKYMRC